MVIKIPFEKKHVPIVATTLAVASLFLGGNAVAQEPYVRTRVELDVKSESTISSVSYGSSLVSEVLKIAHTNAPLGSWTSAAADVPLGDANLRVFGSLGDVEGGGAELRFSNEDILVHGGVDFSSEDSFHVGLGINFLSENGFVGAGVNVVGGKEDALYQPTVRALKNVGDWRLGLAYAPSFKEGEVDHQLGFLANHNPSPDQKDRLGIRSWGNATFNEAGHAFHADIIVGPNVSKTYTDFALGNNVYDLSLFGRNLTPDILAANALAIEPYLRADEGLVAHLKAVHADMGSEQGFLRAGIGHVTPIGSVLTATPYAFFEHGLAQTQDAWGAGLLMQLNNPNVFGKIEYQERNNEDVVTAVIQYQHRF